LPVNNDDNFFPAALAQLTFRQALWCNSLLRALGLVSPTLPEKECSLMRSGFDRFVILCVDDSETGLALRRAVLEQEGYWVFVAQDAARAIAICQQHPVALIVADHMLQGQTGIELAARMKASCPNVPIMMVSGTQPDSLHNIDCFLHKGEPVPAMLSMVRDLIRRQQS
jgi:CheY-like chemotaxis protein